MLKNKGMNCKCIVAAAVGEKASLGDL